MPISLLWLALVGGALAACGSHHDEEETLNLPPAFLGKMTSTRYDGQSDDLLTAGLGASGLAGPTPAYADPAHPTAAELRRNAIHANYRAVLDIAANSGYGSLYGPNVDAAGNRGSGQGKVAGSEYLAYADDGSGKLNVTLMVQVPDSFDPEQPCIVTATSSGSRGVYGAIGSAGEWGLKNRCAVAYSDKGSGTGLYTFEDDAVNLQNGLRTSRPAAGKEASFAPALSEAERASFSAGAAGRMAFKHAHSQQNPEKDWGKSTLQAVEFALYVLNEKYAMLASDHQHHLLRFTPANTITIASSISNGAGAALLAAEQDTRGLISGVAVSEPQIQLAPTSTVSVRQGATALSSDAKALLDYSTFAALYQPCIAATAVAPGRCQALAAKGLLSGGDLAARQADALARLHAYGWLADSDPLQAAHAGTNVLVAVTYAYAYGKFSVTDKLCGFSFAASDASGVPVAMTDLQKASSFASQNGIIGSVIYEDSIGGARAYPFGVSPSSQLADQSLDGFLCLRKLVTGVDPVYGVALSPALAAQSARVRAGMAEVLASANLHGKPAIIVQGRSDTLIPVNFSSRAYLGLNAKREGTASKLRYIEVLNANHFDAFSNSLPANIVPLHLYLFRALDAMLVYLRNPAQGLPPSQVVRTQLRPDNATPLTLLHLPAIATAPAVGDVIRISDSVVEIPQ